MIKEFSFDDNSKIRFEFSEEGNLTITLQARHLGKEIKITSAQATLDSDSVTELVNWIGDVLLGESNG